MKVVTIYAFSIENFKRSKFEVDALMDMAKVKLQQMAQHGDLLDRYGAKVRVLGRLDLLKPDVLEAVNRAVGMTSRNGERVLNICFPYTSRDEITGAIRDTVADYSKPLRSIRSNPSARRPFSEAQIALKIRAQAQNAKVEQDTSSDNESTSVSSAQEEDASDRSEGPDKIYEAGSGFSSSTTLHLGGPQDAANLKAAESGITSETEKIVFPSPETITRQTLTDHMLTKGNPPLDLLIRTSGVERLSDFMLWQCDEDTEIVFLDVLWPEFDLWHFLPVLLGWQRRISKSKKNPDAEGNFDGDIAEVSDAELNSSGKVKGL